MCRLKLAHEEVSRTGIVLLVDRVFLCFFLFIFASVVGPRSLWWWIFFHFFLIGATLFIGILFLYFTPFQICVGIFSLVFCLTFYVCHPCFHIIILICLSFSLYSSLAVPSCIRICLYLHLSWCLFCLIQTMFRVRLSIFLKWVDNGRLSRLIVFCFFSFILNFFLQICVVKLILFFISFNYFVILHY